MYDPVVLTTEAARQRARRLRDQHWRFMERVAEWGTLWWCLWNKHGLPEGPDEFRMGLLSGMLLQEWMNVHPDWWDVGAWDETRYAWPVSLTDAGREALTHRDQYDLEPVAGGLVEPGWICTPLPREGCAPQ